MIPNGRRGIGSVRLTGTALMVLAGSFWVVLAAWAQTIRIPDFRQAPEVVSIKPGEPCNDCGRILAIREIQLERKPDVPPAFQSGAPSAPGSSGPTQSNLVGAVIYLPLGASDTPEKPFVGGVGTPEMRERFRETSYEITVRLDDGSVRFVQRYDGTRYRVGDRVRLAGAGQLELITN